MLNSQQHVCCCFLFEMRQFNTGNKNNSNNNTREKKNYLSEGKISQKAGLFWTKNEILGVGIQKKKTKMNIRMYVQRICTSSVMERRCSNEIGGSVHTHSHVNTLE